MAQSLRRLKAAEHQVANQVVGGAMSSLPKRFVPHARLIALAANTWTSFELLRSGGT
jgi:hypothetical protein